METVGEKWYRMKCPVCSDILVSSKEFCPECGKQISVVRFPSLWKRFFAIIIDGLIASLFWFISLILFSITNEIFYFGIDTENWGNLQWNFSFACVWLIYTIAINISTFRGTIGKIVFGMIVIYNTKEDSSGIFRYNISPIAYGASIVRQFMWLFYALFPIVSLFWYGSFISNKERNAWHERSSGTIVVHKPS